MKQETIWLNEDGLRVTLEQDGNKKEESAAGFSPAAEQIVTMYANGEENGRSVMPDG